MHQLLLQRSIIFDNTVMDQGNVTAGTPVRMSIHIVGRSMSGPACMTNANGTFQGLLGNMRFKFTYLALALIYVQLIAIQKSYPRTVVSTVFQTPESVDQDGIGIPASHIPYYPAHCL